MGQPLKELVDNVQDDYDTHSMSSSNVTLNTILTVQAPYETSAWINLSAVIWGFPLNLLILVIGFKKKNLQNSYLFTVLCMTFCQFYAVLMESALYIFYLIALNQRWQMTLLTCSIIRRFLQTSMTPANLSTLILSIDRYIFILHSKKIRSPIIGFVFGLTFVYSHFIYFPLQIFGRYGSSDICGPALGMSPSIGYFVQPIEPICICIAFFVNLRIVLFISKQRTSKAMALRGIRKREFKEMRFAMFGLLIQSLVPFVFALPQTVNLAAYNIDRSFRFSDTFWKVINFFMYLELSINAVVTLVFVRQFRVIFVGWIRGQQVYSTGSGGIDVIRTFTTSGNPVHHTITVFAIARRTFRSKQVQSN